MDRGSPRATHFSLFLLSAATLLYEINLTRLFSVAQFYHFAFMIVSIALLGFGASGTALSIFPALRRGEPGRRVGGLALAAGLSMLAAYWLTNALPFDSFAIAWDGRQAWILALHYLALALPFFCGGLALGFLLNAFPQAAGRTYAVNLLGSAAGCLLALAAPGTVGGEGVVTLSALLAIGAGMAVLGGAGFTIRRGGSVQALLALALGGLCLVDLGLRLGGAGGLAWMALRLSPYKSLSYTLQAPGAQVISSRWNAFSRVDMVQSGAIHALPGLSYRYLDALPAFDGLLVDGDDLNPVPLTAPEQAGYAASLPVAAAFHLRPQSDTLVLEPRGGLDVLAALALSSGTVTAVDPNPLVLAASQVYAQPRVQVVAESGRSFLQRSPDRYEVILLPLTSAYHPVRSGAYTLAEDYRYTVEAFTAMLGRLETDGVMLATRWLQDPPSEDLRLFALAVTALERGGADPGAQIVAFRGYNTATVLVKNTPFTAGELAALRDFLARRAFDLTYAPDVQEAETNRYNILPAPTYYRAYTDLLEAQPREAFYGDYAYDVRPPSDDHPFFGHYFKWAQAPQALAELGRAWQPFGGAGYFVLLGLLGLALLLSAGLILLPLAWRRGNLPGIGERTGIWKTLLYFGFLGLGFLLVEIPLLQRFILYLGQPAYAATLVLFSLLFFSGLGSRWSERLPLKPCLAALALLILASPWLLQGLFEHTLGLPLAARFVLAALSLAPLGGLMGVPFPSGVRLLEQGGAGSAAGFSSGLIPWAWAVNGAASVAASILAALLALTFGFGGVLALGALCYAGAWLTAQGLSRQRAALPLVQ